MENSTQNHINKSPDLNKKSIQKNNLMLNKEIIDNNNLKKIFDNLALFHQIIERHIKDQNTLLNVGAIVLYFTIII